MSRAAGSRRAGRLGIERRVGVGGPPPHHYLYGSAVNPRIALQGIRAWARPALGPRPPTRSRGDLLRSPRNGRGARAPRLGETVERHAQNFGWQFAAALQKWPGRWAEMPVDAHMLIALSAPRPVFITGGTADQWADPVGEYLAAVAAGPLYRLLGRKDLGITDKLPPLDTPVTSGDIGWHYHTGGHTATPADWNAFLVFLDKYFK